MVRIPTHREPTHPGEMLLEEFLIPMGITQRELANEIIRRHKELKDEEDYRDAEKINTINRYREFVQNHRAICRMRRTGSLGMEKAGAIIASFKIP